jgi:two-component system OmpR family response regulator
MKLLIIEDDQEAVRYLLKALEDAGHEAEFAFDGDNGLSLALQGGYDVLLVDRMLPKLDGLSLINRLREKGDTTPALILSALGQVDDRIEGLKAGGDDYLSKPYAINELLARIEVLARRARSSDNNEAAYQVSDLKLNRLTQEVSRGGQKILLQPRE